MNNITYSVPLKSTGTTYLWWLFLGGLGAHKFYLGRPLIGVIYALTLGLLGLGLLWDLFTIPSQVRKANHRIYNEANVIFGGQHHGAAQARIGA